MTKGWFVGRFVPTALQTDAAEVAVKEYVAGAAESAHYHKVATEVTLILSGRVRMNEDEYTAGDIVSVEPGEVVRFTSITDSVTVVVKTPCVAGDKYVV